MGLIRPVLLRPAFADVFGVGGIAGVLLTVVLSGAVALRS